MSGRNAVAFEAVDVDELRKAGGYRFYRSARAEIAGVHFGCPCACGRVYGFRFLQTAPDQAVWSVQGEWPTVTVVPSLGCLENDGSTVHWHGFLRNGVFEEC